MIKLPDRKQRSFIGILTISLLLLVTTLVVSYGQRQTNIQQYAATTSCGPMPVGNLPGWQQNFTDDFTTDAPLGSFYTVYGSRWSSYGDNVADTTSRSPGQTQNGYWYDSKVLSVSGGILNIHLHTELINGVYEHLSGVPTEKLPGKGDFVGQSYGRYSVCMRADPVYGYKTAFLLWADGKPWPANGEIDFPESLNDLKGPINAAVWWEYGTYANNNQTWKTVTSSGFYNNWHVYTIDWTPNALIYSIDGNVVQNFSGSLATWPDGRSKIPLGPMSWHLQTETSTSGETPNNTDAGNVQVDWAVSYAYSPSTTGEPIPTPLPTNAPTPSVSPTPLPVNQNLLANPGCESNTNNWTGWHANLSLNTSVAHSGSSSCNVTQTDGTMFSIDDNPPTVTNPQLGQQYSATAWVRSDTSIGKPLWLAIRTSGGAEPQSTVFSPISVNASTSWQQLTNTVSVDYADRTSVGMYVIMQNATGTDSFQADDMSLQLDGQSPNPTVTPTHSTTLTFPSILLQGIGKGGDAVNPNSVGTAKPLTPQRSLTVAVYDASETLIATRAGTITFSSTAGDFSGTVNMGQIATGNYIVKITTPQYLTKQLPGIISMTQGQNTTVPSVSLIAGDINGDNSLNVLDYNALLTCYSDFGSVPAGCSSTQFKSDDLNDDGKVDAFDLNLFLREISIQNGQ